MSYKLITKNEKKLYEPVVEEGITWTTDIKGTPSDLKFKYLSKNINIREGNAVNFKVDGKPTFFGFVFDKKRNKDGWVECTCYDQLRYLKNKDTYMFKNKRADQIVKMLAADFKLKTGNLENTKYAIPKRLEENTTLFDMIQNALDLTLQHTKQMYVLYDDFGKLTLQNIGNRKINILLDDETGEDFNYSSSIDNNTYNKIKLTYDNKDTGTREVYITKSSKNINEWGVLQYFEKLQNKEGAKTKANNLLKLYNQKTRELSVKNVIGDVRVRAGTMVAVRLNLGDVKLNNWMLVTKAKHTFGNNSHRMDLNLKGGLINA